MKPENIQLLKKTVAALILALVLFRVMSSFLFFSTNRMLLGARLPVVLTVAVILLLLLYGYLKSRAGGVFFGNLSYVAFLLMTIAALMIYIIITRTAHHRQVAALTDLIVRRKK